MIEKFIFHEHQIFVYSPKIDLPEEGLPVLYILDGNAFTNLVVECLKLQSRNSPKTGVWPALIVGIGYLGEKDFFVEERFKDFTFEKQHKEEDVFAKRRNLPQGGGLKEFIEFLKKLEVYIVGNYKVNKEKQGIFGHSLGGLCVLELFISQSLNIQRYFACSPSIWWDNREILQRLSAKRFISTSKKLSTYVGENEGNMVLLAELFNNGLVDKYPSEQIEKLYIAPEENHMSIVPTIISRVLRGMGK